VWHRGVIYQIYLVRFRRDATGSDDLPGILSATRLPLPTWEVRCDLVVTDLSFADADFGYDVADTATFEPLFGDSRVRPTLAGVHARRTQVDTSTSFPITRRIQHRGSSKSGHHVRTRNVIGISMARPRARGRGARTIWVADFRGSCGQWMIRTQQ